MLFLFKGEHRELARFVLGLVILSLGLLIHHGILLVAVGAVLAIWGAFGTVSYFRGRIRGGRAHAS